MDGSLVVLTFLTDTLGETPVPIELTVSTFGPFSIPIIVGRFAAQS